VGERPWFLKKILILSLIFLILPSISSALETGDAYLGVFGGYQEGVFGEEDHTHYFGLKSTLYQPTLNWGDYRFKFLGFYRNNQHDQFKLGYLGAAMKDLWLSPGYQMDAFLGDGFMHFVTPPLIFEHLGLPGQSLRGVGAELQFEQGGVGLQAGRLTEGDYLIPEAVNTIDEDLVGAYLKWNGPKGSRLAGAIDYVEEEGEDRLLATLYGSLPLEIGELRVAGWYDSVSDQIATIAGIRRPRQQRYAEVGFLYIPEDFNYISTVAPLPRGETLLFGTYRFNGIRRGYYIEGSGGQIDESTGHTWLIRGSLGGYYRILLRDIISSGLHFSYQDADSGSRQVRLDEHIRYTHRRSKWDTSLQFQAMQWFDYPEAGEDRNSEKTLRWIGELRTHYRSGSWDAGAVFNLEHGDTNGQGEETSALIRLEGRTTIWFGLIAGAFFQGGIGWREDGRSEVYGGGMEISSPLPLGWQLRIRLRAQRSNLPIDTGTYLADGLETTHTTVDLFAIIERRTFWGKPTPVIGTFVGPKPRGIGVIKGRVFVDMNGNAVFDTGDKPLGGVVVRLDEGFLVETDVHGLYHFPNVASGQHHLNLDPASFPINYINPRPDGIQLQLYPRDKRHTDWPLKVLKDNN